MNVVWVNGVHLRARGGGAGRRRRPPVRTRRVRHVRARKRARVPAGRIARGADHSRRSWNRRRALPLVLRYRSASVDAVAVVRELCERCGLEDARVRMTLAAGPAGGSPTLIDHPARTAMDYAAEMPTRTGWRR